jgi:hypothetical protein
MGKRQVKVSESLFDPLNLTHNALVFPPIAFCRKAGLRLGDLCSEGRDMGSKGITLIACAGEIMAETIHWVTFSEHLLLRFRPSRPRLGDRMVNKRFISTALAADAPRGISSAMRSIPDGLTIRDFAASTKASFQIGPLRKPSAGAAFSL